MDSHYHTLTVALSIVCMGFAACSSRQHSGFDTTHRSAKEVRVVDDTVAAPRVSEIPAARKSSKELEIIRPSPAQQGAMAALSDPHEGLRDVFFALDSATVSVEAQDTLRRNMRLLRATSGWKLTIEGHCDERGSSAYNLVLGERRARAVSEALADLGVPAERMELTSFGEQQPFCSEHSEPCWAKNRRAHFSVHGGRISAR